MLLNINAFNVAGLGNNYNKINNANKSNNNISFGLRLNQLSCDTLSFKGEECATEEDLNQMQATFNHANAQVPKVKKLAEHIKKKAGKNKDEVNKIYAIYKKKHKSSSDKTKPIEFNYINRSGVVKVLGYSGFENSSNFNYVVLYELDKEGNIKRRSYINEDDGWMQCDVGVTEISKTDIEIIRNDKIDEIKEHYSWGCGDFSYYEDVEKTRVGTKCKYGLYLDKNRDLMSYIRYYVDDDNQTSSKQIDIRGNKLVYIKGDKHIETEEDRKAWRHLDETAEYIVAQDGKPIKYIKNYQNHFEYPHPNRTADVAIKNAGNKWVKFELDDYPDTKPLPGYVFIPSLFEVDRIGDVRKLMEN